MMVNRTLLLALSLLLGCGKLCAQTNLTVAMMDGVEFVNELSTATRITFANDSIFISSDVKANTALLLPIADVQKLQFTESIVTGVKAVEDCILRIYPNPVHHSFTIEGVGDGMLSVYSIIGAELLCMQYKSGESVDVNWLNPGNYIIRYGKCVVKFTKR